MTTQILRTIDRWRFEIPLSLALGASAGFAALSAPAALMAQVPVAGDMGTAGRAIVAALLAAVSGGIGYGAMRRPAKAPAAPASAPAAPIEATADEEEQPSGMAAGRFARFRRADAHPDAPPREPIIASRDLGEPFMDIGDFATTEAEADPETHADQPWWPDSAIPDADFVELPESQAAAPAADREPVVAEAPVAEVAETMLSPLPGPVAPPRPGQTSITAMMDRLSAGLERRAIVPPRDPGPALRDALAELNRLAEKRG